MMRESSWLERQVPASRKCSRVSAAAVDASSAATCVSKLSPLMVLESSSLEGEVPASRKSSRVLDEDDFENSYAMAEWMIGLSCRVGKEALTRGKDTSMYIGDQAYWLALAGLPH